MTYLRAYPGFFAVSTRRTNPVTGVLSQTVHVLIRSQTSDHPCHNGSGARPEVLTAMRGHPV